MARKSVTKITVGAWMEYLAQTKNVHGLRYEEVEPWAWTQLQKRLKLVRDTAVKAATTKEKKKVTSRAT